MLNSDETIQDVSKLANIEICLMLAKIKGLSTYVQNDQVRIIVEDGDDYYFNPIDNAAQALDLAFEFTVLRDFEPYDCLGGYWYVLNAQNQTRTLEYDSSRTHEAEITLSKAICLAVLEAHHGKIYRG